MVIPEAVDQSGIGDDPLIEEFIGMNNANRLIYQLGRCLIVVSECDDLLRLNPVLPVGPDPGFAPKCPLPGHLLLEVRVLVPGTGDNSLENEGVYIYTINGGSSRIQKMAGVHCTVYTR